MSALYLGIGPLNNPNSLTQYSNKLQASANITAFQDDLLERHLTTAAFTAASMLTALIASLFFASMSIYYSLCCDSLLAKDYRTDSKHCFCKSVEKIMPMITGLICPRVAYSDSVDDLIDHSSTLHHLTREVRQLREVLEQRL